MSAKIKCKRSTVTVKLLTAACTAALAQQLQADVVTLNASQAYVQPTSTVTNPGATANGNGSTADWSFTNSTASGAAVWSDGPLDNPGSSASYNNSSGGATTPAANDYDVTGTSSNIVSLNSPYLALGATATFYGNSLNLNYGALNLNTIYDASGASTNTYNFSSLTLANSSIYFNDYYGSLYKVINGPISLSGSNAFNSSRGSYTESETFNGTISGSGTMTFTFAGGSTRVVNFNNGSGSSYTGAVTLGTTSGTSTFNLNTTLGSVSTYTIGTSWTLNDAASNINGSNAAVTGTLNLAGATETLGNLTGAGTVTSATTTALTLNGAGTFSGTLSGSSLSIVKTGSGNQVLSGAASYGGNTNISGGTLTLGNSFTSGSEVDLNVGTLASGTATTIASNVIAAGSTTIAPGGIGTAGTLTIGGLLVAASPITFNFDLGTGSGTVVNGDLITFNNAPSIASGSAITFNNSSTSVIGNDYRLFGGAIGYIDPSSFTLPAAPPGQAYALSNSVDSGYIDLVVTSTANSLFWDNLGGGGDGMTWDSAMQNWNNGSTVTNFNSANGDIVTFNDTNNGNFNVTIPATVTPGSTTVSAAGNYNFSGAGGIGGSGGLVQNGTGILTLGTTNTFTGGTTLSSGTINLANTLALQSSTLNMSGGTLTFNPSVSANAFTLGGLTGSGNIALVNTAAAPIALTVGNDNASTTYAGILSGAGSLNKIGTGILTVSGSNTYTGGTTLTAGELSLAAGENPGVTGPLGASGTISFAGGTLQFSGSNAYDYSSRFSSAASQAYSIDTNGQNVTFASGLNSAGGSLTKLGAGTLTLSASNTYTGVTTINAGTLQYGITGALPATAAVVFSGTSTLDVNGYAPTTLASITVGKGVTATLANAMINTNLIVFSGSTAATSNLSGGVININGGTIDASAAGGSASPSGLTDTVASQITGTGGLTIKALGSFADNGGSNTGYVNLTNTSNSFTGGVTVTEGLLNVVGGDGVFNNAGDPTTNPITLDPQSGLIASGAVTLNTASIVLSGSGNHYLRVYGSQTLTLNGVISDGGAGAGLYKTDGGTVVLNGSNSYTGTTTVQDGTVTVNGNESGATGGWTIGNGSGYASTVNFAAGSVIDIAAGKAVNIGTLPSATVVSSANETLNDAVPVTNLGTLSIGRSGYLEVNSGGTWNQSGAVSVQPVNASGYSAYLYVNTGGAFNYTGSSAINLTPSIDNGGYGEIVIAGTGIFTTDQGFSDLANSNSNTSTGSAGVALIALNTGGTLALSANIPALTTTAGNTVSITLGTGSGGVINTNGFNTATGATISGTGGVLNKIGLGTLTLSGANTYTGGSNANAGVLAFSGTTSYPAVTDLNVAAGATAAAVLHTGTTITVLQTNNLNIAGSSGNNWTGLVDLNNNDLTIHTPTVSNVFDQIQQGFHGGAWNGTGGITSTAAANNSTHLTAVGFIVNNDGAGNTIYGTSLTTATNLGLFDGTKPSLNDVLVKYTYYGDANLDGAVDGSDYTLIDAGFAADQASSGSATGWYNGDFNYDGVIDGSDYTLIDNAFNTQGASLGVHPATLIADSTAQIADGAVPEPASLGLLGIAAAGLLGRRRRR
jgi:fibronectin-binding autotransporter adhesin